MQTSVPAAGAVLCQAVQHAGISLQDSQAVQHAGIGLQDILAVQHAGIGLQDSQAVQHAGMRRESENLGTSPSLSCQIVSCSAQQL